MILLRYFMHLSPKNHLKSLINTRSVSTVAQEITKWTEKLSSEKISEPESSVRNLLAHVLETRNLEELDQNPQKLLTESQLMELETLVYARLAHMPIQYIIKEWDFRDLKGLKMVPPVFIPRPETEELVSYVISDVQKQEKRDFNFLEVGCGSGVISISLLRAFPEATGTCFDQNQLAVDLTKANADDFGVLERLTAQKYKLENGDLPFEGEFDLIVSNPPYLFSRELIGLADDIKVYEDLRALDGGKDGLIVINNILQVAEKYLKTGGSLWLETHPRHHKMLGQRYDGSNSNSSLLLKDSIKDFCDKDRFIKFVKN